MSKICCLGMILSQYGFDDIQRESIVEALGMSTDVPSVYLAEENCSSNVQLEALEWLIKETQHHFFVRSGERYGLSVPQWIDSNAERLIDIMSQARMLDSVLPKHADGACIAVLGATGNEMAKRFDYLHQIIDSALVTNPKVYLLVGERFSVQG